MEVIITEINDNSHPLSLLYFRSSNEGLAANVIAISYVRDLLGLCLCSEISRPQIDGE